MKVTDVVDEMSVKEYCDEWFWLLINLENCNQ